MNLDQIVNEVRQRTANFDGNSYQGFLAIQVSLTDLQQVFYVEIKDGRLSVEPYDYQDRQANLIISSDKFMKLIDNQLNPVMAFTTGQLRVEGDPGRALELANLFKS